MFSTFTDNMCKWTLSPQSKDVTSFGVSELTRLPFKIGRQATLELTLNIPSISGLHAMIYETQEQLFIEDLGSRNGTFVNGNRTNGPTPIESGDLIQIANSVFRLIRVEEESSKTTLYLDGDDASEIVEFEMLMCDRMVTPLYQSIVTLSDYSVYGWESLGRGTISSLRMPAELFKAAERMQQQVELSRMLREIAAETADRNDLGAKLFLNTHYDEIYDVKELVKTIESLKTQFPNLDLVLEVHESTVTDIKEMKFISSELKKLDTQIAYDDFGAGQARFFELVEEPPDYLKFDIRLIRGIHKATERRLKTLEGLVQMVERLGICCLAEGLEEEQDAVVCRELGFQLGQGYYFSRPEPIESIAKRNS